MRVARWTFCYFRCTTRSSADQLSSARDFGCAGLGWFGWSSWGALARVGGWLGSERERESGAEADVRAPPALRCAALACIYLPIFEARCSFS